jgi:hypothetical protein
VPSPYGLDGAGQGPLRPIVSISGMGWYLDGPTEKDVRQFVVVGATRAGRRQNMTTVLATTRRTVVTTKEQTVAASKTH